MDKSIDNELSAELDRLERKYRTKFSLFMRNVIIIATVSVLVFTAYSLFFNVLSMGNSFKEKLYIILFGGFSLFEILGGIYFVYFLVRIYIYIILCRRAVDTYTKKTVENLRKK
ncbi:TPA: hypothetical protein G8W61_004592 [Salmonella enterica]|uniref:DUF4282 domain-containing protein n=1 Tax=Salmonella enterica TaxID=28901 RepID=A0A760BHK8_SALER|nr:hypothetical protein [Salmonella enterica subsp. enterica serovar Bareilly]ECM3182378.1 hypothetical protein [Salmonella enterica subsp. enterica serovar Newport]HAG2284218.1 hypothetical protein [Salmonella enterica]HCL5312677.1 hypothetical protein [Salmonella enterica]